jgi:hypothetical protein
MGLNTGITQPDCSDRDLEFSLGPFEFARIADGGIVRRYPVSTK